MPRKKKVKSTFPKQRLGIGAGKRKKAKKQKKSDSYTIVGYDSSGNPIKRFFKGIF